MTAIPGDINPMPPQAETVTTTDTTNADAPQLTEEQAAEREEQDFAAGFKVASSERLPVAETRPREGKTETPTGEAAPTPKSEATDPSAPKTEETPKPPEDPEVPGLGMKASEVRAALKKADDSVASLKTELGTLRDQAMGHVGNLKKAIDSLKTNPVTGKPQTVTAEQLKRVAGEFPEIAALLAEDLSGLVLGSSTHVDTDAIQALIDKGVQEQAATIRREAQINLLTALHRDWRTVRKSAEFGEWKATLPAEAVQVLESTSDGLALAEAFDDYKAWLKNGKKAPGSEPPAPDLGKKEKDKRLAAAVEPEGKPRAPGQALLTDEEAFEAGYREVRSQRLG
jgi:hypothetical protein